MKQKTAPYTQHKTVNQTLGNVCVCSTTHMISKIHF